MSSSKSITEKLLIKDNYRVLLVNEIAGYRAKLGDLPKNVSLAGKASGQVDLIQIFLSSRKELESQLPSIKPLLKPQGLLWVTYPKEASKMKADINRDIIREFAETIGLKTVAQISIDETWSALRLKIA